MLHQLDRDPAPLLVIIGTAPGLPSARRYVEALLWAWCQLAPHCSELHANLPVRDGGRTLGEFDPCCGWMASPGMWKWHANIICGRPSGGGADLHDAWLRKFAAEQQLRLSRHPLAQAVLLAGRIAGWVRRCAGDFSP